MSIKKYSRRDFFKIGSLAIIALFAGLWDNLVRTQKKFTGHKKIMLSLDQQPQVSFHENLIIIKGEKPLVFSARCPHLGCRINKLEGDLLICPCHGSSFQLNGKVSRGPAPHSLQEIEYTFDPSTLQLIIDI